MNNQMTMSEKMAPSVQLVVDLANQADYRKLKDQAQSILASRTNKMNHFYRNSLRISKSSSEEAVARASRPIQRLSNIW